MEGEDVNRKGHTDTVKLLLDRGANIEEKDNYGITPIHRAAWEGQTDTVEFLLDRGANIEEKNNRGYTPIHSAAENGKTDTVELLLDRGAHIEEKDDNGDTRFSQLSHMTVQKYSKYFYIDT